MPTGAGSARCTRAAPLHKNDDVRVPAGVRRRAPRPGRFRMLRLTELKLPLDEQDAINSAILGRLKLSASDLIGYSVFRRATDARKRNAIA
jgi:hypothetical protein